MQSKNEWGRRGFLIGAGTLAAAPLMGTPSVQAQGPSTNVSSRTVSRVAGRRKLGALEVSSVGLGVQNMSRTYQTTVPTRPEMHQHHPGRLRPGRHLLRRGRGLRSARGRAHPRRGRGAVPRQGRDRDQVRLEHRSGDRRAAAGAQQPARSHQASWSRACSSGFAPTASTCSTSTASTRRCRSRTSPARSRTSWPRARSCTGACPRWG